VDTPQRAVPGAFSAPPLASTVHAPCSAVCRAYLLAEKLHMHWLRGLERSFTLLTAPPAYAAVALDFGQGEKRLHKRTSCDCAPAKHEATAADQVSSHWRRLLLIVVFVLMLRRIACPLACAGPLRTRALMDERGYKFCANGQTGTTICPPLLIFQPAAVARPQGVQSVVSNHRLSAVFSCSRRLSPPNPFEPAG